MTAPAPHLLRRAALALLLGGGSLFASSAATTSEDTPAPLTLLQVFAAIRDHHPGLAAARASTEAARARVDVEKAWTDPRLGFDVKRDTTRLANYSELEATVSQELPLSGRARLRGQAAIAESAVAYAQSRRREWMLFNQARLAFTRLAATDERLCLNTRLHDNLVQSRALARQAYETGQRTQIDLLTLETELIKTDGERTELTSQRIQAVAELNALMLRPVETGIATLALPEPVLPALALGDAVARARVMSPEITVALRELDAARAKLAVVRKNRAIDPEVSFTARQMNNSGQVLSSYDTGISFSVPWANPGRTRAELVEARSRITAARAEADASEAEIAGRVAATHARASASFTQVKRYQDELLPLSRAFADAARRDYETGRAALPSVLAAQRMTLETELQFSTARAEQALAIAELCFLTSEDVQP
jgi:outer membrane protein TolC